MTDASTPRPPGLPNLIVIGAMKCGTTSLHRYLDLHPEIGMSNPKEPNFFLEPPDGSWRRGVEWYASLFDARQPVRGESSAAYANLPRSTGTAQRMASVVPRARLIYMVRDPLARSISNWAHARALGLEHAALAEALAEPDSRYVARSLYMTQLRAFLDHYPADRVLVIDNDELRTDRHGTLAEAFRFLGVDDSFLDPRFARAWEVSSGKGRRYEVASRLSRRLGRPTLPSNLRWWLERLVYPPAKDVPPYPALPQDLRECLLERFQPEVEGLRKLTGKPLAGWSV